MSRPRQASPYRRSPTPQPPRARQRPHRRPGPVRDRGPGLCAVPGSGRPAQRPRVVDRARPPGDRKLLLRAHRPGAAQAAYGHGFSLVLCDSDDHPDRERDYFDILAEQRAVGVVVVPLGGHPDRLTRLRRRGIPLVLTDRKLPPQVGCSVAVDDVTGGRLSVDHLLDSGARQILVVNGGRGIRQCTDRYQGARQAIRSHAESVRRWRRVWEEGGAPALRRRSATGRPPKLDDTQVE
ncbi:hypothetical protein AB0P17_30965 [Streptomyces sp. NPDC088124]|uniref:hypothetical protein n=1 Tax=Streptomyces sp. NPDC088124 TaxID=3154654 RepID=UPI00343359E1